MAVENQSNTEPALPHLRQCPHCQAVLEHYLLARPGEKLQPAEIDADLAADVASGELFSGAVLPQVIKAFELVQEGGDRPEKQAEHDIRMAAPANGRRISRQRRRVPAKAARVKPAAPPPTKNLATPAGTIILDHPRIGGKLTVCALLYGDYIDLHKRCISSILSTIPEGRMDLRIAGNEISQDTQKWLETLPVNKLYLSATNKLKYPQMRAMFHDRDNPIQTPYVLWFDDDSYVRDSNFLDVLGRLIVGQPEESKMGQFGHKMYHKLGRAPSGKDPKKWLQGGTWWKGRQLQDSRGRTIPNGNCLHFCVGGFWAMSTRAIRDCDVPDQRLRHNGGDILCSQQLYQNGYNLASFNENKQFIHTSAAPRRGFSENFPWYE